MEVDRENRAGAQVMFGDQVHVRWLEQNGASYEFEGLSYIGDISEPRCEGNKLVWTKSNRDPALYVGENITKPHHYLFPALSLVARQSAFLTTS
jgi:hypothetical protein